MSKSLNLFGTAGIGVAALFTGAYNFADRNVNYGVQAYKTVDVLADRDFALIASAVANQAKQDALLNLGREATTDEIASWDIDVRPDGMGLPVGKGNVSDGEEIFVENCAICHGDFGEGVDRWPVLAGGQGSLTDDRPVKTIGSYWPYLSTVYDYIYRAMPFGNAQSLSHDEVYAITAYLLYSNDIVGDDFELSNENFLDVEMPNADNFYLDDRAETEYTVFTGEVCMTDCKPTVEVTARAAIIDVTPEETAAKEAAEKAKVITVPAEEAAQEADEASATEQTPTESGAPVVAAAASDVDLAKKGEKIFKKCKACHQVGDGAKNRTGPVLNGIVGAKMAAADGFKYSDGLQAMGNEGQIWDIEALAKFLTKPKAYVKGTKMSFAGLRKENDIAAVTEYLKSFSK